MNSTVRTSISFLAAIAIVGLLSQSADAHTVFKKHLEKKYENLKVRCEACHVKGEEKTVRNEFGKLFYKKLADQNLTQKWRDFEERADKKAFEADVMVPAFNKALEAIKEMTNEDDETYADLIAAAKIENIEIKEED